MLAMVNDILNRNRTHKNLKNLLNPYFHPRGIKELATYRELRIAYAAIHLLDALQEGSPENRLSALRSLREETLHTSISQMRVNTARVLLQIMKELLRAHGDYEKQLLLAHDFRMAATGKPRTVLSLLDRYHLLEMPEEWNQLTFDNHVHDANTKGRKTPTHLAMDAWIKGIRHLTVVYYNNVQPAGITELLEAAKIMDVQVQVGIEFPARFREKFAYLIWSPKRISDPKDFLSLFENEKVKALMEEGAQVSDYQHRYVTAVFNKFNEVHRHELNARYGVSIAPLDYAEFIHFVGSGQASTMHMADFVFSKMQEGLKEVFAGLRDSYATATDAEKADIEKKVKELNDFEPRMIAEGYLVPSANRDIPNPNIPHDAEDEPPVLKSPPDVLLKRLKRMPCSSDIILNLNKLTVEDVIELLFDCDGMITHLEIFNMKDYLAKKTPDVRTVEKLINVINDGNIVKIKEIIRNSIQVIENSDVEDKERAEKFKSFLGDIEKLRSWYRNTPLKKSVGSDSAGRMKHTYGMGFAIKETLPWRARRKIDEKSVSRNMEVPLDVSVKCSVTVSPEGRGEIKSRWKEFLKKLPGFGKIGFNKEVSWMVDPSAVTSAPWGTIISLGGIREDKGVHFVLNKEKSRSSAAGLKTKYLNTSLRNQLKVLIGFIPAFLTFALTKEWVLLKYGGAFIWFGITGMRNIVQSILAGRGLKQYSLLRWSDFVKWERVADSLLYTGFSVPLLDFLVKMTLLDRFCGINTTTNPIALYSIMALVNGIYISSHNMFRGLPKGAVIGNFFRSILSIPLALLFNSAIGGVMTLAAVPGVNDVLQKCAAIISKLASDCVAAFIEGSADRRSNIKARDIDFDDKLSKIFYVYSRIEILFPENDVADMMRDPKTFLQKVRSLEADLDKITIINALDLMYFWMYQPRARTTLKALMKTMTEEERRIIVRSMNVLKRNKEVSQLFVDGVIGKNFSKALAFYLDNHEAFLKSIADLETALNAA